MIHLDAMQFVERPAEGYLQAQMLLDVVPQDS